ncbi:hypothetical protein BCR41DRAFT_37476 [Lobosporangium transversale]|uniref:Uncharacterized protein n=1 Tax=Lobosporangium transversale TaxID=64571 RepID=A0A1Y2GQD8_9FUNG|nr:hypothetical protein BCR41DRAFT_37476 [Lobosporangium transversale]ORZ19064.1 hypothetical protein BCR41DRAFT_37476 [Lobosporangium transversale]|eukprot:XP_021882232.1 hypothetical protein BCR41DRAFT_37476 [Lobosporangium transversale]
MTLLINGQIVKISHASAVKDEGRAQSLASVQAVTRDTLEIFNTTDSCSSVSTAPSFTTSAVSSTPYDVTNSDMNKEKQQQSSKRTRDNENSVETPIMKHVCKESRRDLSFSENGESVVSTSVLYSWDFLDGPGRLESNVSELWMCDGVDVGGELMACRDRIVENNGGLTGSYEKLAINFIFLIEAEYQVGGLQGEVEDQTWDIICKALKDPIQSLSGEALFEAHQWTHRLANSTYEELEQLLADSAPQNSVLKTILMKMVDGRQLWTTKGRNEDTYLKCQLGPFLDIYLGNLKHTMSV